MSREREKGRLARKKETRGRRCRRPRSRGIETAAATPFDTRRTYERFEKRDSLSLFARDYFSPRGLAGGDGRATGEKRKSKKKEKKRARGACMAGLI